MIVWLFCTKIPNTCFDQMMLKISKVLTIWQTFWSHFGCKKQFFHPFTRLYQIIYIFLFVFGGEHCSSLVHHFVFQVNLVQMQAILIPALQLALQTVHAAKLRSSLLLTCLRVSALKNNCCTAIAFTPSNRNPGAFALSQEHAPQFFLLLLSLMLCAAMLLLPRCFCRRLSSWTIGRVILSCMAWHGGFLVASVGHLMQMHL